MVGAQGADEEHEPLLSVERRTNAQQVTICKM
jgi:hypothetical protein